MVVYLRIAIFSDSMMPENPFTVDASRIISMRDFVVRTFGEAEGGAIFNTQAEEFRGKFVYVFEVGDGNNKWEYFQIHSESTGVSGTSKTSIRG